jgi:hypothetical protein
MIPIPKLTGRLGNQMFQFAYIYAQMKRGAIPDTYLQDELFFKDFSADIKALYGQNIHPINQVSIHVRRGDYVGNPFYVNLTETNYYEKAMDQFPGADFLVFSDDITWCKEQALFDGCEFAENDEITDFNLMAGCCGHIIANSSFSWWAAYVGSGKTVAPRAWYSDGIERTKCPAHWVRL